MLESTAAAGPEMPAGWLGAPGPGGEPINDPAFAPGTAPGADAGADVVAGHSEGEKDRLPLEMRDAVALCADPLDKQIGETPRAPLLARASA